MWYLVGMKTIGFLIERDIWEDDEGRVLSALVEKRVPFTLSDPLGEYSPNVAKNMGVDLVFCYGSLQWIDLIRAAKNPQLCTIWNIDDYDCQAYYPHFSKHLFNQECEVQTLEHFRFNIKAILEEFGGKVFMRPSSGFKNGSVSGGVFDRQAYDEYIEFFTEAMKDDDNVVFGAVKPIDFEWRTVIDRGQCITGCQYKSRDPDTGRLGVDPLPKFPDRAKVAAERIATDVGWSPDDIYVMDIVESEGKLSVMEINALSTSGWYDCDAEVIAEAVVRYFSK